ncbi:hypothetical protein PybrP1_004092 [[Pythium] brassicae (nom. inval.)]|nr:hypothetical protein PybrP1_004092 [[Pythium] brassicae (nom. inval.)]
MADSRRVLKEGFLKKRSRNSLIKKFQRRYFKLYANELVYSLSATDLAVRRRVALGHDSEVLQTNDQGIEHCFVAKAHATDANFYLQAESEAEKNEWVVAIFEASRTLANVAPAPASPSGSAQSGSTVPRHEVPKRVLLQLTIQAARNLQAADFNGKSDPFCVVGLVGKNGEMIRSEEMKTNYITNTLSPEWKAKFVIGNAVDLHSVDALHLELWDHDHFSRNTSLGFVRVPLSIFQMSPASTHQTEVIDNWFRVEPPPQKASLLQRQAAVTEKEMLKNYGDLHLTMSVAGPNLVSFFQSLHLAVAPRSRIVNAGVEHSDNRLELTVLSAKDLISADFNNSSDPFCEVSLLDAHGKPIRGETYTTDIKYKTRNPTWDNAHHVFGMVSRIDDAAKLKVRVVDWDRSTKNDPLGSVVIDLDTVSATNAAGWYELQPEPGMAIRENLGAIQLRLCLFGESRGERKRRLTIYKEVAAKTHEQSVEQLELENAQYELHDAACKLDGARIACAVSDYQARDPRFYGINGCIHQLNSELPRAHEETKSSDEGFQARAGLEGQALLEISVVEVSLSGDGTRTDVLASSNPYAVIEVQPAVCVEDCKRTSAPLSPQRSKRIEALNAAAADARNPLFSKRANAEVSTTRAKLASNEIRSENASDAEPGQPVLKVQVVSGHGLSGVDRGGYSDPYCTLTLTDRATGKPVDTEKKKTAIIPRTLNPVWANEVFVFGKNHSLHESGVLLIHVKDHNNLGRSTPLGRVQIPLEDLCHASAKSTSIASTAQQKRYPLTPEPWMKKHAQDLGELCIKTEVVGDATVLAEMLQRQPKSSPEKMLSFLSFSSFTSDPYMQGSQMSQDLSAGADAEAFPEYEDEVTETLTRGQEIRTATAIGNEAKWRKEKFELSLSYPGMFSDSKTDRIEHYTLHLRVHGARGLVGAPSDAASKRTARVTGDEPDEFQSYHHRHRQSGTTNAYFTIIPVLGSGELAHGEKKQSLTVYGTRNPSWPEHEFVFGKAKDIATISHLSLHVYSRNLFDDGAKSLSLLLDEHERSQVVRLRRHQLLKLDASGEASGDDIDVLRYDQRVLAFRKCQSGGRYFPARVLRYYPFPRDEYQVLFEGAVESIEDIRNLFSIDVKGKIKAIRADGNADVVLLECEPHAVGDGYARNVSASLLTPVQAFTPAGDKLLAKPVQAGVADASRWDALVHSLSALKMEVLSAADLPKGVARPGCFVTLVGNPRVTTVTPRQHVTVQQDGTLRVRRDMPELAWEAEQPFSMPICHCSESTDVAALQYFENRSIAFGNLRGDEDGVSATSDRETLSESQQEIADAETDILAHVASILIRVVDQGEDDAPTPSHPTVGFAKIDLAGLRDGEQLVHVKLTPPDDTPYFKFVGAVNLHIVTAKPSGGIFSPVNSTHEPTSAAKEAAVCGFSDWFERRQASLAPSALLTAPTQTLSRIERRAVLRASLTPTENAQVDAFHAVLVVVAKRVVSIRREIQLFEQFEALASDEMAAFRHAHTTNADPSSEWLGRLINEMPVETRKDIVVHLEMELLDIAASDAIRVYPAPDLDRDAWVKLRAVRQKALLDAGGFFVQDRTSALVLLYPNCFTGEGMISWMLRAPPVLWDDQWTKYCPDARVKAECALQWWDDQRAQDPDAIQPPRSREHALMWLAALSDAGYMENVTSSGVATGANASHCVVEDRADRYYRLLEVERWIAKQSRDESLFPLDLVREIDCYQQRRLPTSSEAVGAAAMKAESGGAVSEFDQRQTFAKKLTSHVGGLLGTKNSLSSLLLSPEMKPPALLKPVIKKTAELLDDDVLYDWKYCLFLPSTRSLYMYEAETSSLPFAVVDMNSTACRATYNASSGWFEIANATVFVRDAASRRLVPISGDQKQSMLVVRKDGSEALELKAADAQVWVQALAHAGVAMDMRTGQLVVVKQLNAGVLQQKCVDFETEFQSADLEGSFQRLLNRFFRHHVDTSHREYEEKLRAFRTKLRGEMKKTGRLGDTVLAYFGKGKRLNPKPTRPDNFTRDALYSGRIVRVRTPYTDSKYHVKALYDRGDTSDVPAEMATLLLKYEVRDKASWLRLPRTLRDVFLLYDVEYRHSNEIIIEEGMLREHFRAADGDLDPAKVGDGCTDLNLVFKPYDLEDCVTRMAINCNGRKPLGCLKIPIKMVSHHRVFDAWYPLAPENDMVQKTRLGHVRVQLRLQQISQLVRSKKEPALLEEVKDAVAKRGLLQPLSASPMKLLKDAVTPRSRRNVVLPSGSGGISRERSSITITVLEARKLLPSDLLRRDPFVKIDLVHESSGREEFTLMKADVKAKTVNPKWVNQAFTLGKTEKSLLSDKTAILLRVLDENLVLGEVPLGFVRIELQRDRSGCITGLTLVHADAHGSATALALNLDEHNKVEVVARLLGDEKLRQDKLARARENDPEVDGRLGKLRFTIELTKNDNFVEMADGSSPTKALAARAAGKSVDTKYSVELKIKSVVPTDSSSSTTHGVNALDWKQYVCVFQPHGDGGQRVLYDPQSEDLVPGSRNRLSDLLQQGRGPSSSSGSSSGSLHDAAASSGPALFLGKTYDVSKVAYFDVQVASDALGKQFRGKFGQRDILKRPDLCASFPNEVIVLKDRDSNAELHMTVDVTLVGIHRAERLKRVLAETFRLVGLPFDIKTMLHHGSGASGQPSPGDGVQSFLWEVFKVSTYPGRNVSPELLAQAHRMGHATKLHWRHTPQLLCFLFEHVFNNGEKDLLAFRDAAAIDGVLNRWSEILARISDAKTQLIGHLHGRETPQLVQALFTTCDWTGFEFAALSDARTPSAGDPTEASRQSSTESEGETVLRPGARVHVSLPLYKHAGVAVDVRLRSGQFVAGTIVREYGDDSYDVAFCTAAKVRDESDEYFSDDDELPPLTVGQTVFVCPLARVGTAGTNVWSHSHSMEPGRVGTLAEHDTINHNKSPYRVEYADALEPSEEWIARVCLDSIFSRIIGSDMHRQLAREDLVRVTMTADGAPSGASRPAKIAKNHSNARYRVEYLDGQLPVADSHVARDCIQPLVEHALYEGEVVRAYRAPTITGTALVVKYDVQLSNGSVADEVTRDHLRLKADKFVTDRYFLGAAFASELEIGDPDDAVAVDLANLWGPDNLLKVYLTLPTPVVSVQLRDSVTSKLLQAKLLECSAAKPRFIDQCHGFVHGRDLKGDEAKLAQLHAAAVVQRRHNAPSAADNEVFDIANCLCVLLAPQPRVEIHGTLRLSASLESLGLFRSVLSHALKRPTTFTELLQKTLRSAASAKLPLNRKERVLSIDSVTIAFDKKVASNVALNALGTACDGDVVVNRSKGTTKRESVSLKHVGIQVRFHLAVPHNNRGSLVEAVNVAYQDARLTLDVLAACNALYLADARPFGTVAEAVEAGEGAWVLDRTDALGASADLSHRLAAEVLNLAAERGSRPSISLELVPLDDLRLCVRDVHSTVHEVYLPVERLLLEARLRRAVAPFRLARVEDGPQFLRPDHPKQRLFTDGDAKKGVQSDFVPQDDVKFDVLRVHVVHVSQMFIKGAGSNSTDLTAKVTLVSRDAPAGGTQARALPHGVVLTASGEICVDMAQNKYPEKSSVRLARDRDSSVWTQPAKSAQRVITFGHPGIDLERVSAIRVVLVDGRTGSEVVGTVRIPMASVARKLVWSEKEYERALAKDPTQLSGPSDNRTYSIERDENGRSVVVGKITLGIERSHRPSKNDSVLVRNCSDPWVIDPYELLVATLKLYENTLTRGLLAAGPPVSHGGRARLADPTEREVQLRKIANVLLIAQAMESIYATKSASGSADAAPGSATVAGGCNELEIRHSDKLKSPHVMAQLKHALSHTKWVVEDTAAALGIKSVGHRLPWSSDPTHDDSTGTRSDFVVVHATIATSTLRLRRTILKLYHMYRYRLTPTLQKLYELDAKGDRFALAEDEKVLRFFEEEVDDLDEDDQAVFRRVHQRLRLAKLCQVLDAILCTTLRVKVMDQNPNEHDLVGLAQIPLVDLLDQQEHCHAYKLTKPNRGFHANALRVENLVDLGLQAPKAAVVRQHGRVVLRLRLTYSQSALLEQAINVYKFLKAKYIMQHETAHRRINAAVVPAQRRRWATVQGHLDELLAQASGKLHWERTPLLLSLVWDIFAAPAHKPAALQPGADSDALPGLVDKVEAYRAAVVRVQNRWANVQPMLDELLVVQAAPQIHAQRTETLLQTIADEVEGLDVVLGTAWQQVHHKWTTLKRALEALVAMKETNKIHLGRAPQLLSLVSSTCRKGLNDRHADAVANVQFRWMAITQSTGPLAELRLMEKTGLHWRRTHELVLLLREQCEGFADVDARALEVVESRWKQVQEWLDDVLGMHHDHKIDCEATPFILQKLHMLERSTTRRAALSKPGSALLQPRAVSPSKRDPTGSAAKPSTPRSRVGGRSGDAPTTPSSDATQAHSVPLDTAEVDAGRLEGLLEWYAIEEARYELERLPTHRLTSDADRSNWLPFSQDGKDTRLSITQEEMALTAANVRAALEDRGVIPRFSSFVPGRDDASAFAQSAGDERTSSTLPTDLLHEIAELESAVASLDDDDAVRHQVLANPERFAELSSVIENLGKTDLLWKIEHVVNTNRELEVPTSFVRLLDEMKMRQIPTNDIENVARTLTVVLQKEALLKVGVDVPSTANFTTVLSLMHRYQVKDVALPASAAAIQALLHERGMDRRGEPVFLRGMRIGTRPVLSDDPELSGSGATAAAECGKLNVGLGLVDAHIELLRKALLFEALRKRNSLVKTFPGETRVLRDEDLSECPEVDMSGDYLTLVERFQQLLVHEAYTKRLASYAALDRCMRALLRVPRDAVVTKEDIAIALQAVGAPHRLPLEAFTRDELLAAARAGKIRSPTEAMLRRCPQAKNANAMAYYAAVSHAAMVYQETTSFSSRFDPVTSRFQDALPFDEPSSVDGLVLPKDRSRMNLKAHVIDWLLGSEDTAVRLQRQLGAYHQQRLVWASAAATLGQRWFQRGFGWCDDAARGVGVKVLLHTLLVFEAANRMHMVRTDALLREVNDKCTNLRARDKAAKAALEQRYARNAAMLETLVGHAERCINNRKLHSEETPALLHALEQVCVVPAGLSARHMAAYHVVTSHWLPHRARLDELVQMHKEGTFSIQRTPELLGAMAYHTEGLAGAREVDEANVYASVSRETTGNQQEVLERKIDEIRRGQRKAPSSLHLDLDAGGSVAQDGADDDDEAQAWKALSPSKPMVEPLSPREKQTSWRVVTGDSGTAGSGVGVGIGIGIGVGVGAGSGAAAKQSVVLEGKLPPSGSSSPRRKSSLGDELKELLKSSTKWLLPSEPTAERIRPELFFPQAVAHDSSFVSETPRE